jgi:glycosyltransferase involved in cell wall biosynthesis
MKKPIKVAIDVSPLLVNKSGIGYYTELLAQNLANHFPNDVELIGFYYNFLGRRSAAHFPEAANIRYRPVRFIPSKIIYQLRRFGVEIPIELLIKEKVDFILYPNFLDYPSLRKTPSAAVVHDLTYIDLPQYVAAKNGSDLRRFVPNAVKRSKFLITVSEFGKKRIHKEYNVPLDDILVTPIPPFPLKKLSETERKDRLRHLKIDKPFILFVGNIEPRKNIPALVEAFTRLPKDVRDSHSLVIVGGIGWNCEKEVQALADAVQDGYNVIHTGYVSDEDKEALYSSATLFAHASAYEGFCMPVLEAMTHGVPCVLNDMPVFREVAGDAAIYFDSTDPDQTAATLKHLLGNQKERETLSKKGIKRSAIFSWSTITADLFALIKQQVQR